MLVVAARRTPEQKAEAAAFVNRLYVMSKSPSWQEFARRAGVWSPNLSKWQTGTSIPDGWNLFRLICEAARAGDALKKATPVELAEIAVAAGPPVPEDPRDLLAGLASAVASSDRTNRLILDRLEAIERVLPSRAPGVEDPLSAAGG